MAVCQIIYKSIENIYTLNMTAMFFIANITVDINFNFQ